MKRVLVFYIISVMLLCVNVSSLFAEAPTIPKILFTSARDGNWEVYIMNPDGSEQVNLTQHPSEDLQAVWSPTGEQILFISDRGGIRDLYLMDPDGSNVRRVFKKETDRRDPAWSPDGKQIAYVSIDWDRIKSPIYIATIGEQEAESIVEGFFPAWSPDGTEIAYVAFLPASHSRQVTLIDVHTKRKRRLLPKKAMDWQNDPSWSATGDKLIFSWNKNPLPPDHKPGDNWPLGWADKETIYIVNRDGTGLQQLVAEAGPSAKAPELSPNGDEILYTQEIKGRLQIFKVDVNSGIQTQLTHVGVPRFGNSGGDWFDPAYALPVSPQPQLLTTTWAEVKK